MVAFKVFLFASNFLLLLLFLHFYKLTTRSINETCYGWRHCGRYVWPPIRFPFKLRDDESSERCGYVDGKGTGFELFCGRGRGRATNQTLITLPYSGDFAVKRISYTDHKLWINDPNNCLPKQYIYRNTISTEGTPFKVSYNLKLIIFYKCTNLQLIREDYNWLPIPCMSDGNTTVIAKASFSALPESGIYFPGCKKMGAAYVPLVSEDVDCGDLCLAPEQLFGDFELQWTKPSCTYQHCEEYKIIKNTLGLGLAIAGILCFAKVYSYVMRRRAK